MPASELQLSSGNKNYTPDLGRLLGDMITRVPHILTLPFTFNTADAATLYTVPTGLRMAVLRAAWDFGGSGAAAFTGGASSAIGISSNDTGFNTKGDILGGATGDVAATLVASGNSIVPGTLGAKFGSNGFVVLGSGKIVRFDRITSAFTAGVAQVMLQVCFIPTS